MKPMFNMGLMWDPKKDEFTVVVSSSASSSKETYPSMRQALKRMEQLMKNAQKNLQRMVQAKRRH